MNYKSRVKSKDWWLIDETVDGNVMSALGGVVQLSTKKPPRQFDIYRGARMFVSD